MGTSAGNRMLALILGALLLGSGADPALAGIPEGYEEADSGRSDTRVFVNPATGATFAATVTGSGDEEIPALELARSTAGETCPEATVSGDSTTAEITGCAIGDQQMSLLIISQGGRSLVLMSNDHVTEEEAREFISGMMKPTSKE